jgi:hypothetical protein
MADEDAAARDAASSSDAELAEAAVAGTADGEDAVFAAHPANMINARTPPKNCRRPMAVIMTGLHGLALSRQ